MTACDREQLLLLAAGELEAAPSAALQEHLAGCRRCTDELVQLRDGLGCLDRLPPLEPAGQAVERTRQAAGRVVRRYRLIRPNFVRRRRFALALAASLALLLAWSVVKDAFLPGSSRAGYTAGQLRGLWNSLPARVFDSNIMADDLAYQHATDEWTNTANTLIASAHGANVTGELIDIQDSVNSLQEQVDDDEAYAPQEVD